MAGVGGVEVAMRLAIGDDATAAATAVVCRLARRRRPEMRRHGVDETLGCGVDRIVVVLHQLAQRPGSLGRRTALRQASAVRNVPAMIGTRR